RRRLRRARPLLGLLRASALRDLDAGGDGDLLSRRALGDARPRAPDEAGLPLRPRLADRPDRGAAPGAAVASRGRESGPSGTATVATGGSVLRSSAGAVAGPGRRPLRRPRGTRRTPRSS